ncbi:MAG: chorismate mutase [Treponema sp.]
MVFGKKVRAGRAAVCARNTAEDIHRAVVTVYEQFVKINAVHEKDIIAIHFSITSDLIAANPATLLRSAGYACGTALFCCSEPYIEGSMQGVIRLLFYYYGKKRSIPVYANGAEKLRPDLFAPTHNMF